MIGISKLYCGAVESSDSLRYQRSADRHVETAGEVRRVYKPVVVWNATKRCNLQCEHCYSHSGPYARGAEMTTEQGRAFIEDLAQFGAPVILFSGGEPLLRDDLGTLMPLATRLGLRAVLSTNGTLIDDRMADDLRQWGAIYVGISIDGGRLLHDRFRGRTGAYDQTLQGIARCRKAGLKLGLRFTITPQNAEAIGDIFKLAVDQDVARICFYHLVYTGRANQYLNHDLDSARARAVIDQIIDLTAQLYQQGLNKEILTVDNHADGAYLYLLMARAKNPRADEVLKLLTGSGGNRSGMHIASVGWDGTVHPDQFWRHYSCGNVVQKPFSEIWTNSDEPLLAKLRDRKQYLHGRCRQCRFLELCNGNLRVRAEAATGDLWACDPACYLTDEEISA